jgi:hypothetical protein
MGADVPWYWTVFDLKDDSEAELIKRRGIFQNYAQTVVRSRNKIMADTIANQYRKLIKNPSNRRHKIFVVMNTFHASGLLKTKDGE